MDPQATLQLIVDAAKDNDAEALYDSATDLADWIKRGGFMPAACGKLFGETVVSLHIKRRGSQRQFKFVAASALSDTCRWRFAEFRRTELQKLWTFPKET